MRSFTFRVDGGEVITITEDGKAKDQAGNEVEGLFQTRGKELWFIPLDTTKHGEGIRVNWTHQENLERATTGEEQLKSIREHYPQLVDLFEGPFRALLDAPRDLPPFGPAKPPTEGEEPGPTPEKDGMP